MRQRGAGWLNDPSEEAFDGDALNGVIMLDDATSEAMERLATHHGMLDLQKPYAISPDMALPAPVISMVDEWLRR